MLRKVISSIKSGNLHQVYFLKGDDYFLQDYLVKYLEKAIFSDGSSRRELLMPDDMSQREIIDQLTQTDLFSTIKLFVLRNPQKIKNKYRNELLAFCEQPVQNHYLIIIMDDYYSHLTIIKSLEKHLMPIDVRKPYERELRLWTKDFFDDQGFEAPPSVIESVLDIAGDSVFHIANQVEKICLGLNRDDILTPEFVLKFAGWSKEYRSWEFLDAVGMKDLTKALIIGNDLISRSDLITLIPNLTTLFLEMLLLHFKNGTYKSFKGFIPLTKGVKNKLSIYAKKYSQKEIKRVLAFLGEIDRSIKTSNESDKSRLSRFLFSTITDRE